MKNTVSNDTRAMESLTTKGDGIGALALGMLIGTPEGIVRAEARGQQQLVESDVLPAQSLGAGTREVLEAAGVVFGGPVPGDPLFVQAILPPGWKKTGTEHSMHSNLLDEKGRVRATIFYKTAFYDRRADIHAVRRFSVSLYENCDAAGNRLGDEDDSATHFLACIKDSNNTIHILGPRTRHYDSREPFEKQAEDWLAEHYPDWKNPGAYWD